MTGTIEERFIAEAMRRGETQSEAALLFGVACGMTLKQVTYAKGTPKSTVNARRRVAYQKIGALNGANAVMKIMAGVCETIAAEVAA